MRIKQNTATVIIFIISVVLIQCHSQKKIASAKTDVDHYWANQPNAKAYTTLKKFFNCWRMDDCFETDAPIKYRDYPLKNVRSVKAISEGYALPVYYAEFDSTGKYLRMDFFEPYSNPAYFKLVFDYTKKDKFVEITQDSAGVIIPYIDIYAKNDTLLKLFPDMMIKYSKLIYRDGSGTYKRTSFNDTTQLFDFSKTNSLEFDSDDSSYQKIEKNLYKYSSFVLGHNGYDLIYFNDKKQITKIETYLYASGGGTIKETMTISYTYYPEKK